MLRVNELFVTVQGEATFTGRPATFIRLQGCPVGCPWCDTKHTWPEGRARDRIDYAEMLAKVDPAPTWCEATVDQLVATLEARGPRHVVLTGGEPCAQDLYELTLTLAALDYTVQVETSGTHEIAVASTTWVTVSPKVGMAGGLSVREDALRRADEIKMPIAGPEDLNHLEDLLEDLVDPPVVWLQPVSQDPDATQLCIDACIERGWFLSLQTHKFAGVR